MAIITRPHLLAGAGPAPAPTGLPLLRQHPLEETQLLSARTPLSRYPGLGRSAAALSCLTPGYGKTWSAQPPWLVPRRWYGRDVIRMRLDLCLDGTTS